MENWRCRRTKGLLPILSPLSRQGPFGLVSRQGLPCHNRACRPGAQPGLDAPDRLAHATAQRARLTETLGPVSGQNFLVATGFGAGTWWTRPR